MWINKIIYGGFEISMIRVIILKSGSISMKVDELWQDCTGQEKIMLNDKVYTIESMIDWFKTTDNVRNLCKYRTVSMTVYNVVIPRLVDRQLLETIKISKEDIGLKTISGYPTVLALSDVFVFDNKDNSFSINYLVNYLPFRLPYLSRQTNFAYINVVELLDSYIVRIDVTDVEKYNVVIAKGYFS